MSLTDHRGSVYLFQQWMRSVQQEIRDGTRAGARQVYVKADGRERMGTSWAMIRRIQAWRRSA